MKLLRKEQSDQGLYCLTFKCIAKPNCSILVNYGNNFGAPNFRNFTALFNPMTAKQKLQQTTLFIYLFLTSIAAAAGGSRRRLPKAGVERSSYVGIAYTISVKLSN